MFKTPFNEPGRPSPRALTMLFAFQHTIRVPELCHGIQRNRQLGNHYKLRVLGRTERRADCCLNNRAHNLDRDERRPDNHRYPNSRNRHRHLRDKGAGYKRTYVFIGNQQRQWRRGKRQQRRREPGRQQRRRFRGAHWRHCRWCVGRPCPDTTRRLRVVVYATLQEEAGCPGSGVPRPGSGAASRPVRPGPVRLPACAGQPRVLRAAPAGASAGLGIPAASGAEAAACSHRGNASRQRHTSRAAVKVRRREVDSRTQPSSTRYTGLTMEIRIWQLAFWVMLKRRCRLSASIISDSLHCSRSVIYGYIMQKEHILGRHNQLANDLGWSYGQVMFCLGTFLHLDAILELYILGEDNATTCT